MPISFGQYYSEGLKGIVATTLALELKLFGNPMGNTVTRLKMCWIAMQSHVRQCKALFGLWKR
jgi:hypothetical protein